MPKSAQSAKRIGYLPFAFFCVLACWSFFQAENLVEQYAQGRLSVVTGGTGRRFVSDFVHFYVAGTIAGSSESHHIYDWDVQEKVFQRIVGFDVTKSEFYTQYMPQVFTMMVPMAQIPVNAAHLIWDTATLLFGATGLWLFARRASEATKRWAPAILLLAIACYPAWQTLINGQLSWLLLGLFSLYFVALLSERPILAGLPLALCAIKPQYVLFALLPLVFSRRFKTLFSTAGFVAIILIVSALNVGFDSLLLYPSTLHQVEATVKSVAPELMPCVRGLLSIFLPQDIALSASGALSVGALLLLAVLFKAKSVAFKSKQGFLAANAIVFISSLFFSAHTHAYDCLLIAVSGTLFWAATNKDLPFYKSIRRTLTSYPLLSWLLFFVGAFTASPVGMQLLALLNLLLFLLLLAWFLRTDWKDASKTATIE